MGRAFIAVIAGTVSAFVVILIVETIGSFASPAGVAPSPNDAEGMRLYLSTLPLSAYGFMIAAYLLGSLAGGIVAGRVVDGRGIAVWLVGALVLAATIANVVMIPRPAWFVGAAVAAVIAGTALATRLGRVAPRPIAR